MIKSVEAAEALAPKANDRERMRKNSTFGSARKPLLGVANRPCTTAPKPSR